MIFALQLYIKSDATTVLDSFAAEAPARLDVKVWQGTLDEYDITRGTEMDSGIPYLQASIRFFMAADRQAAWDKIKSKVTPTVLSKILTGSYVDFHDCNHDESNRVGGCGVTERVWSK